MAKYKLTSLQLQKNKNIKKILQSMALIRTNINTLHLKIICVKKEKEHSKRRMYEAEYK